MMAWRHASTTSHHVMGLLLKQCDYSTITLPYMHQLVVFMCTHTSIFAPQQIHYMVSPTVMIILPLLLPLASLPFLLFLPLLLLELQLWHIMIYLKFVNKRLIIWISIFIMLSASQKFSSRTHLNNVSLNRILDADMWLCTNSLLDIIILILLVHLWLSGLLQHSCLHKPWHNTLLPMLITWICKPTYKMIASIWMTRMNWINSLGVALIPLSFSPFLEMTKNLRILSCHSGSSNAVSSILLLPTSVSSSYLMDLVILLLVMTLMIVTTTSTMIDHREASSIPWRNQRVQLHSKEVTLLEAFTRSKLTFKILLHQSRSLILCAMLTSYIYRRILQVFAPLLLNLTKLPNVWTVLFVVKSTHLISVLLCWMSPSWKSILLLTVCNRNAYRGSCEHNTGYYPWSRWYWW